LSPPKAKAEVVASRASEAYLPHCQCPRPAFASTLRFCSPDAERDRRTLSRPAARSERIALASSCSISSPAMSTATEIVLVYVMPALGMLTANFMFAVLIEGFSSKLLPRMCVVAARSAGEGRPSGGALGHAREPEPDAVGGHDGQLHRMGHLFLLAASEFPLLAAVFFPGSSTAPPRLTRRPSHRLGNIDKEPIRLLGQRARTRRLRVAQHGRGQAPVLRSDLDLPAIVLRPDDRFQSEVVRAPQPGREDRPRRSGGGRRGGERGRRGGGGRGAAAVAGADLRPDEEDGVGDHDPKDGSARAPREGGGRSRRVLDRGHIPPLVPESEHRAVEDGGRHRGQREPLLLLRRSAVDHIHRPKDQGFELHTQVDNVDEHGERKHCRCFQIVQSSGMHSQTKVVLQGCFWAAFGFGTMDWFILVPNGLGACQWVSLRSPTRRVRISQTSASPQKNRGSVRFGAKMPQVRSSVSYRCSSGLHFPVAVPFGLIAQQRAPRRPLPRKSAQKTLVHLRTIDRVRHDNQSHEVILAPG
ncbi:hypothetical protein ACHAWF_017220, partial [Thalassiosira exigua]